MVPQDSLKPTQLLSMTNHALKTNDEKVNQMMQVISHQNNNQNDFGLDLKINKPYNQNLHSLLGQDQKARRNEKSIRMSSASAAVNLYRNYENSNLMRAMKHEFNKQQCV